MTSPPGILTSTIFTEERAGGELAWPAGVFRASFPRGPGEMWQSVGRLAIMGGRIAWGAGRAFASQHLPHRILLTLLL